jgi:NAD+ diphosphatase
VRVSEFELDLLPALALARSAVDRAAHHRDNPQWLERAWADASTRVVRVAEGRAATVGDPPVLDLGTRPAVPADRRIFLGVDEDDVAYFAAEVADADESFRGLREIGWSLGDRDAGLLVNAVALLNWHATHQHCPRCGAATEIAHAGHLRVCTVDGTEHYPRTDPAVIMTVVDSQDRLLLGRQATWPAGRFSTLAGFVEPGESLEHAVRREVGEEVGLVVGAVRYLGSQPWPFPSSLMLGFRAQAETVEVDRFDGEIAEARWFTRAGLRDAVRSGDMLLSPPLSIARRLIEHWYGEPITDSGEAWR